VDFFSHRGFRDNIGILTDPSEPCHAKIDRLPDSPVMFENLFAERGLSLDRLRVLVEVHDAGSIAAAAPDDPVRQSQYSRQIRELSEYFGCDVARREGKVLKLTRHGSELARLARDQMQGLQDFRAECQAESVDYQIAAGDSLIQWLVLPRVGRVLTALSGVRIATANLRTKEIAQQLGDGQIDFGVLRKNAVPRTLKSKPLGRLDYVLVVPAKLRASRKPPTLAWALRALPWAMQKSDGQFNRQLHDIALSAETQLEPALLTESFPQTLSAVKTGDFAGVLPRIATQELKASQFHQIEDPALAVLRRDLALAWNPRLLEVRRIARKLGEQLAAHLAL
jgi:DNA-binding transcriptional LysR family regulator